MALTIKTSYGADYLYFQAGPKSMYIAPKNDHSKANQDNVIEALKYTQKRIEHYVSSYDELLQFLPPKERKQYERK